MIAELKGKISSSGSNLSDRLEDKLTGDFFGALRYIPFNKVMQEILKKSTILGNNSKDTIDFISKINVEHWDNNIKFWPYNSNAELDVILEFEEIIIGIEVKLYSGLSSDDNLNQSLEYIEEQSINQLARESIVLKEKIGNSNKRALLILIAPEEKVKKICCEVYNRNIIEEDIELGYLSWEEILEEIKQICSKERLNDYDKLILEDIVCLLRRKGLERFKDFKFEIKNINKDLWFKFNDFEDNRIEFNFDYPIDKEAYYEFRN